MNPPPYDPAQPDPAQQDPAQQDPAQQDPAQQDPAPYNPAQHYPAQHYQAQPIPPQHYPAQQNPMPYNPARPNPAQQNPAPYNPAQQNPAQQNPARQNPVQSNPAQSNPAQQNPAQQNPAQQNPQPAAVAAPTGPQPTYKQLSWSLKLDGDPIKVPEIKSEPNKGVQVAGAYDLPVLALAGVPCQPKATPIPLKHVPPGHDIVVFMVKIDAASTKDAVIPLIVVQKDAAGAVKSSRDLSAETSKPPVVFSSVLKDQQPPPLTWTVEVLNENKTDIKLVVQIAYGP